MGKTDINARLVRFAWWTLATIVFTLVIAIRIRLWRFPLERDEGEYAYAGQVILQGIPPYKLAYNMKFPGTYAGYPLIMSIFGQTTHAIHLGLLLLNAGTIALIFLLGGRLIDSTAAIAVAACYAVCLGLPILSDRRLFFEAPPVEACRMVYPECQFPESIRIAEYIHEHTGPDETIAVLDPNRRFIFTQAAFRDWTGLYVRLDRTAKVCAPDTGGNGS